MEYKYEIVSEHPLDIPESLRLDDGFADVIGKSLKVGLEMGYAEVSVDGVTQADPESLMSQNRMDGSDYQVIKVAYPKLEAEPEVAGGTTVVLTAQSGAIFRKTIESSIKLSPAAFADRTGQRWNSVKQRLRLTLDLDRKTANLMAKYYSAVEDADWSRYAECLSDHIKYTGGSWFSNDGDLYDINTGSHGYARGIGSRQLIATAQHWREQYRHVRYDLDMSRCMMNETTAIISFRILKSENGVDWENALPIQQCISIYQIEHGKVASVQHMVGVDQIDTVIPLQTTL